MPGMRILLVRHGQAVEEAPGLGDAGRWLTQRGRKVTRKVARWLGKTGKRRPTRIWTSPLVRAVETAEILAAEAGYRGEVEACAELSPGRDPGDLLRRLSIATAEGPLALVGHEPSLSLIARALLGDVGVSELKKGGVMGIAWEGGVGELWFVLDPAVMKADKKLPPPAAPPAAEGPEEPGGA
jgi:phosphohistidine phosphatase